MSERNRVGPALLFVFVLGVSVLIWSEVLKWFGITEKIALLPMVLLALAVVSALGVAFIVVKFHEGATAGSGSGDPSTGLRRQSETEGESTKGKSMEDRARDLVPRAQTWAINSLTALGEHDRDMWRLVQGDLVDYWFFLATVASVGVAFTRIPDDVPKGKQDAVGTLILEGIESWNPVGTKALKNFLGHHEKFTKPGKTPANAVSPADAVGHWMWRNLEEHPDASDETKEAARSFRFVRPTGFMLHSIFSVWWNTPLGDGRQPPRSPTMAPSRSAGGSTVDESKSSRVRQESSRVRLLGDWIGQRRVKYLRIHDVVFETKLFTRINFAEHRDSLERIANELESVDGHTPFELPFPLSPEEEEFLEQLQPYLVALVQAVRALASICARLATEAAGTNTGTYRTFREDVRQYEIVAGGYAKLGDRLTVLHRSLPP